MIFYTIPSLPLSPLFPLYQKKPVDKIWVKNQGIRVASFIKIAWKLWPLQLIYIRRKNKFPISSNRRLCSLSQLIWFSVVRKCGGSNLQQTQAQSRSTAPSPCCRRGENANRYSGKWWNGQLAETGKYGHKCLMVQYLNLSNLIVHLT